MADQFYSPLRYPGGKGSLSDFLVRTINSNNINYGIYAEGFAGGAGAALKLLMLEHVGDIYLNDKDPYVYTFWKAVLNHTDELCKLIHDTKPTIQEWEFHKSVIYNENLRKDLSDVEIAFTTFFLNRCNRSGILKGGVIGGTNQTGDWKIDARYNKKALVQRIEKIALYKDRIQLFNWDILKFLTWLQKQSIKQRDMMVYLDPPYVVQGKELYTHYFTERQHNLLAEYLQNSNQLNWIVSYDDHPLIHRIYREVTKNIFEFNYFANRTKVGRELVITSKQFHLPPFYDHYSKRKHLHTMGHAKAV